MRCRSSIAAALLVASSLLALAVPALASQATSEVASKEDNGAIASALGGEAQARANSRGIVLEPNASHLRFISAFLASVSMIIVSEFGDKTFFIAAIMAMRNSRAEVFSSAMSALALMTVLSAAMGQTLPAVLDPKVTHYMATALFFFFGAKLLKDALGMESGGDLKEELEEVEEELQAAADEEGAAEGTELLPGGASRGAPLTPAKRWERLVARVSRFFGRFFSKVFLQCFSMTFLAEWGDRSQIATIALAAQKDAFGVTSGGIFGHAICTGVAVLAGKLLATRISEKTILLSGGVLFLVFGIHSAYYGEEH